MPFLIMATILGGFLMSRLLVLLSFGELQRLLKRQKRTFVVNKTLFHLLHFGFGMAVFDHELLFVRCFHDTVFELIG